MSHKRINGNVMADIVDEAVAGHGLVSKFQPVVALPDRQIVGFEALARWPAIGRFSPMEVLLRAQRTDRLTQLDSSCIQSAISGALAGNSTPGMLLLINCEPSAALADFTADRDFTRAADLFRLTFEITERGLL